ncbi:MAG: heme-binding protein [Planctomycetota bacterium]
MNRVLFAWIVLPVAACASFESDPNKIPAPVEGPRMSAAATETAALAQAEPAAKPAEAKDQAAEEPVMKPIASHSGRASEPGAEETMAVRTPGLVTRVGGDTTATIEVKDGVFRFGPSRIESPLPAGYPEPTPPGSIDIKRYPTVRRAEFVSSGSPASGMNMGFFPLFNHIKKKDIAMTSPVEMDYRGMWDLDTGKRESDAAPSWTMSFLYRTAELAPTGKDGNVQVVDRPEMTVVSVGMNGPYGTGVMEKGLGMLAEWLKANPEWEPCGDPRAFHYNGPYIPNRVKWSEIQIPVRRASGAKPAEATQAAR